MLSLAVKPCAIGAIDRAKDNQTHMDRTRIRADATWIERSSATRLNGGLADMSFNAWMEMQKAQRQHTHEQE